MLLKVYVYHRLLCYFSYETSIAKEQESLYDSSKKLRLSGASAATSSSATSLEDKHLENGDYLVITSAS